MGFGDRKRKNSFATDNSRQPRLLHRASGVALDHCTAERLDHRKSADIEIAISELLDNHPCRDGVDVHSTVAFRQIHAQKPEFAHLAQERAVNPPFSLALLVQRQKTFPREPPGGTLKRTLVFRKGHAQFASKGALCGTHHPLPASGTAPSPTALTPFR